jgi:hypothetical protein
MNLFISVRNMADRELRPSLAFGDRQFKIACHAIRSSPQRWRERCPSSR